ncbi:MULTISPECIES: hypothetical protein [unclassified Streptomyces]|uniref:hypothetical protein n=1 Tax=unclassified Streptomyces TaxID=2593676 RepID=UPI00365E017A
MPSPAAHAPERFIAIAGEIVGSEWSPPSVPNWPVNFTHPAADRALTIYPDRKNSRIVFTTASLAATDRRCHAKYPPTWRATTASTPGSPTASWTPSPTPSVSSYGG